MIRLTTIALLAILCISTIPIFAQNAEDGVVEPKETLSIMVRDTEVIEIFRRGQLISPVMQIDSVEFIDLTMNGFGEGDVMLAYPQQKLIPLIEINEQERAVLDQYEFEENLRFSAPSVDVTDIQEEARILESPFAGILATIVKGVNYYYSGDYLQGIFRLDKERQISTLVMWNFENDKLQYLPGSPTGIADTMRSYDLLKVYIQEMVQDTVYVPVVVTESQAAQYEAQQESQPVAAPEPVAESVEMKDTGDQSTPSGNEPEPVNEPDASPSDTSAIEPQP